MLSSFALVSDLHIKKSGDSGSLYLQRFFENIKVQSCDGVVFAGDIFDLLIGPFAEYEREHFAVFKLIKNYLQKNKIIWIEGNHDFHFKSFMRSILSIHEYQNFIYEVNPIKVNGIYIGHGDELDIENSSYMNYRKWVRSTMTKLVIENIVSFKFLHKTYKRFSRESRRSQASFNEEVEKLKFIRYAKSLKEQGFKHVILGHSHIREDLSSYTNLGFPSESGEFILYQNGEVSIERCH